MGRNQDYAYLLNALYRGDDDKYFSLTWGQFFEHREDSWVGTANGYVMNMVRDPEFVPTQYNGASVIQFCDSVASPKKFVDFTTSVESFDTARRPVFVKAGFDTLNLLERYRNRFGFFYIVHGEMRISIPFYNEQTSLVIKVEDVTADRYRYEDIRWHFSVNHLLTGIHPVYDDWFIRLPEDPLAPIKLNSPDGRYQSFVMPANNGKSDGDANAHSEMFE